MEDKKGNEFDAKINIIKIGNAGIQVGNALKSILERIKNKTTNEERLK